MKVLLYFENADSLKKSGIGRALEHQKKACELAGIEYTLDPKDNYDVAHVNTYYAKSVSVIKKCRKRGIPVICHGHSTFEDFANSFRFWTLAKPFVFHYIKKTYSMPDKIITPTPYSKRLIENYPFVKCPVVDLSNGIDLKRYSDVTLTDEEKLNLKKEFKIDGYKKVIMGIGWMFERKGVHDFIEVAKSYPDYAFIWFGALNKAINTKKINYAIDHKSDNMFLPGYVPQDTIIKMLHTADLFMFPSYEETEGIVLLEALATRIPVLLRDIGAFDYLTDGKDVFKGSNNEEFIKKIDYIFNNDVTSVCNEGFKVSEARDLANIGKRLEEEYKSVIK